jgi:hypothetical protein
MIVGVAIVIVIICIIAVVIWRKRRGSQPLSEGFKQCPHCGSYLCDGQKCQSGTSGEPTAYREIT